MRRIFLLFMLACLVAGCQAPGPWRLVQEPYATDQIREREDARVTLNDGTVLVLENARIVPNPWNSYVAGDGAGGRRRQVDLGQIHRLEARKRAPERFPEYSDATQLLLVTLAILFGAIIWNNTGLH